MSPTNTQTDELLRSAGLDGEAVRTELLTRHSHRLRGLLEQYKNDDREGRP